MFAFHLELPTVYLKGISKLVILMYNILYEQTSCHNYPKYELSFTIIYIVWRLQPFAIHHTELINVQ